MCVNAMLAESRWVPDHHVYVCVHVHVRWHVVCVCTWVHAAAFMYVWLHSLHACVYTQHVQQYV